MRSHFAWIWAVTGVFYPEDSEHSFCCFTDYTKPYVCAHRASKTLIARLEAGPALVVSHVSREWAHPCSGLACSSSWLKWGWTGLLAPQSHTTENQFVPLKRAFIQSHWVLSPELRWKEKCALHEVLLLSGCIIFTCLSQPLTKEGKALMTCRRCFETRSEALLGSNDYYHVGN